MINKCKWLPHPRVQTNDLLIAGLLLYQLSYIATEAEPKKYSEDKIFMPCNLSSSMVNGTEFSDLAQNDQTHGIKY